MCYKRARRDMQTKAGRPIRVMQQGSVKSKDDHTWHNAPIRDAPDVLLPGTYPAPGHPNDQELLNVVMIEGNIYKLLDTDIITIIIDQTNIEMDSPGDLVGCLIEINSNLLLKTLVSLKSRH